MSDYLKRYRRRVTKTGNNIGESLTNNTIAFIESTFKHSPTYRELTVRRYGIPAYKMDARVVEIERLGSLREIILPPTKSLDVGTYVEFDGYTWLLYDKHGGTGSTSIKMTAIKCNRVIKWYNKKGELIEYQCVASATDLGSKARQSKNEIEWNKFDVRLPLGKLFVTVENNPDTLDIDLNQRFIFGRNVYEVIGIDDITGIDENDYGIIQFTVAITTRREGDDFENAIAENIYPIEDTGNEPDPNDDGEWWGW